MVWLPVIIQGMSRREATRVFGIEQLHTSKRIFERLRDEHGFAGGIKIVKDYIFVATKRPASVSARCSCRWCISQITLR